MSNGTIRPTRPGAVSIPDGNMGSAPGMQNRPGYAQNPGMQMGQQQSGADQLRNLFSANAGAGSGGGFNWGQYGTSLYEDEALKSLKVTPENDPQSMAYYIERVASAVQQFAAQIYHRAGPFFEEYKKARENFRLNDMQQICEVRNAFIDDVNKQHEFTKIVALNAAPFFGKGLIEALKTNNRDQLNQQEYLQSAYIAIRNIMFLELVNWLMKAPMGKQYALRVPPAMTAKIANLENYKEATSAVFEAFNLTSPYANLEFKRPESTRTDYAMLYGPASGYIHQPFDSSSDNAPPPVNDAFKEIMSMVNRRASGTHQRYQPQRVEFTMGGEPMNNWDEVRKDFNNLTPQNRKEFSLNRYFRNIGKQNYYVIPESDWKKIQHAYEKHAEMGREETVLTGCFRIVHIDLEMDNGWFSTIVRKEGLDMQTVLTDPTKLLPLLENPADDETWSVKTVPVGEVTGGKGLAIDVETCQKLERAISVIAVKEALISNNSGELDSTITSVNSRLTQNFTKMNAVGFCAVAWDVYVCTRPEDKIRLHEDLPFLFKDSGLGPSFFQACAAIGRYFEQGIVDNAIGKFIDQHLTRVVNDWLVNCAGYAAKKGKGHLSVDSILNDFRDLANWLKENDPETAVHFMQNDKENYLTHQVKLFNFINPFTPKSEDDSEITKLKNELELVVERQLYINVVNNHGGPAHLEPNNPIVIKRSRFPEYFKMMEDGFDETMGDTSEAEVTDKVMRFSESGNMWLFSYSTIDRNVATLRHVAQHKPLCLLNLD